ncbi:hypothetical protein B0H10DRAFT_2166582 [Mycena sp. CBHHK59/15]|nr:hypothetical protein B0H10DRAFT_2166582 [Mycena sp. CBHHK59/15]
MHRTGSWEMDNICGPCLYKTVGERPLKFSFLATMDGNNSLKLVDSTFRSGTTQADDRTSRSFRWIRGGKGVEELAKCINTCVDRWRNAGPEARKKMFALFAVAGIFLTVCRHSHVLVMCDMIRSTELMKYPLAISKCLLDQYGEDIGLGYDIMCAFFKTLLCSSLGPRVVALRLKGVVPVFHRHAKWDGTRFTSRCERTFRKSNHLASVTRLATPFHCQQQIDEHFYFHDLDKYASSGNFIYQNYRQAIEKIKINRQKLGVLEYQLGTTSQDYEQYLLTEQQYFKGLRSEPENVSNTSEKAKVGFRQLDHDIIVNGYTMKQIKDVHTRYRTTYDKYLAALEEICRFEERGIENCWTTASKEYTDTLLLMAEHRYKQAVSELERLVIQRLFELTKLGMSGVCYKMREKIGSALKTQAEAIRKALKRYNAAAAALNPPCPRLTWASIIDHASLAEFDWLRETREDICNLPWAQPARREAMVLYFGIQRAKEEKERLDVEITRLLTRMVDDHVNYYRAVSSNIIVSPNLAHELSQRWIFHSRINTAVASRLAMTSWLAGFTGSLFPVLGLSQDYIAVR